MADLRDRTPDFFAHVEAIKRQSERAASSGSVPSVLTSESVSLRRRQHDPTSSKSRFSALAAEVGREVHRTSLKLQKLASLASKSTLFDDPSQEIGELTDSIKQDITHLNQQIEVLQGVQRSEGGGNQQVAQHSSTVVGSLKSELMSATKDFKEILKIRTKDQSLQKQKQRGSRFTSSLAAESRARGKKYSDAYSLDAPKTTGSASGDFVLDLGDVEGGHVEAMTEERYSSSRLGAVTQIESTIQELGKIFQQLSSMVAQQGEMVQRIDTNVDDTLANVEAGQNELLKYFKNISSNRWLILKIFMVLVFFMVIFVVFIA